MELRVRVVREDQTELSGFASAEAGRQRVEATSALRPYWLPAVPLKRASFIQPGSEEWNSEPGGRGREDQEAQRHQAWQWRSA